jgi:hypothetical protein
MQHTELCDVFSDGPCTCQPISVQLACEGSWVPSNGIAIPPAREFALAKKRARGEHETITAPDDSAIRLSIRRYGRAGELL